MKKFLLILLLAIFPIMAFAAEEGHYDKANIDPTNKASLQRGAKTFVTYCMGCHSAKYERYNRMARDLGIDPAALTKEYMVTGDKPGGTMRVALTQAEGKTWFGTPPPDLTLIARARGVDYLYTYLRSFYLDSSRPFGVNNAVFKSVAMPDVFWRLQGLQEAVFKKGPDGKPTDQVERLKLVKPGTMSPQKFNAMVRDLVNFLSYVGEPVQVERRHIGVWVLVFLAVLFVLSYLLKKEYWKDVH